MTHTFRSLLNRLNFRKSIQLAWSVSGRLTITTVTLLVLENLFWMGSVYMLKRLVDVVAVPGVSERHDELLEAIVIAGLISIGYACARSLSVYVSELQATRVNHFVDEKIHRHSIQLDYGFYEDPEYLDVLKRAREAGVDKPYAVVKSLFDIVKQFIALMAIGYILISIDWILLPLLAVFVLPILIGRILFSNRGYLLYMQNTGHERKAHYLSSLMTADPFAKEVRTFSLGQYLLAKYVKIRENIMRQQLVLNRQRTINELLTTGLGTAGFFAVTAYIIFGTLSGQTSVGDIAMFLVVFPQSYSIMQGLVGSITALYHNNMYVAHIFELFALEPRIEKNVGTSVRVNENEGLLIDNVSFRYPHGKDNVLENITLEVPEGRIVAIVGMNGAGKTTLIKLLCRLYEPGSGVIRFLGNDIRNYDPSEYRKKISVVFQDFVRYNLTVSENIRFGDLDKNPSPEAVKQAAEHAGAGDFISSLGHGYDTVLGRLFDDGHEVSIGQWQKLAIARAFYSDSKLVILDEATSSLDVVAETELFSSFRTRIGRRSALVISHRLSTIRQADHIYVMADRRIAESGTHEELMQRKGLYASLYENSKQ